MDKLAKWELDCDKYHSTTTARLPDHILVAILMQHAPLAIRLHFLLNSGSIGDTLSKAKARIWSARGSERRRALARSPQRWKWSL